ncbi:solute carrier family 41 member 1 [Flagelloscypha sp. PMI_526]|nr:solute carrier family 41 member 1 [Flagelloscypha sp. PMI_526]
MQPLPTTSLPTDNDIELDPWKDSTSDDLDLESQPNQHHSNYSRDDFSDEEEDHDDEQALLGQPNSQSRVRGPERISLGKNTWWFKIKDVILEAAPTLLLTTIGLLFTGELLDQVSHWRAMVEVDQLIMIIPVVLNLKGNLEMNLSARLGTAANMGEIDDKDARRSMVFGNLQLLQVQAAAVSFVAACVAFILGFIVPRSGPQESVEIATNATTAATALMFARRPLPIVPAAGKERDSGLGTFMMLAATSMSAACLSGLILGSFMCTLIVLCRKFGRNPDNIAPPIASCLGDLVTLCLVGVVSKLLINFLHTPVTFIACLIVLGVAGTCLVYTRRNPYVKDLIFQGWSPLLGAMAISSATGIVLDLFVTRYDGFALLAVVISGLPGSVGAIFVSRLSTALHAASASARSKGMSESETITDDSSANPKLVMLILMLITLPVEIIFLTILHLLGWLKLPFLFVALSVVFFCCAVGASLVIARFLTNFLWRRGRDPDMYALPVHSALMDLIGQLLLVICFEIVQLASGSRGGKT